MRFSFLSRLSEGPDETALYRTFRHPSGIVAGTLGPVLMLIEGVHDPDPDMTWLWFIGAALLVWGGWSCRMTLRPEGVVVQNLWLPRRYPWQDIQTARMTTPRHRDPVLALYMKDGRRVGVWAVSVVRGIGEGYCERAQAQVLMSLKESHHRRQPPA